MLWTILTLMVVQGLACGVSLFPVLLAWRVMIAHAPSAAAARLLIYSTAAIPSYVAFALLLMIASPLASRLAGWRTPVNAEMRIADMGWPLMDWARYNAGIHLVRAFAGWLLRATPFWSAHLRLGGARLGRRVYINSLSLGDYNLLEFGDDVVIGEGAHISGHTVERGVVKTGPVRLGRRVTIGLGSVVDIGVETGDGCQVGALSLVPKYTVLEGDAVYAGIPVRRIADDRATREQETETD